MKECTFCGHKVGETVAKCPACGETNLIKAVLKTQKNPYKPVHRVYPKFSPRIRPKPIYSPLPVAKYLHLCSNIYHFLKKHYRISAPTIIILLGGILYYTVSQHKYDYLIGKQVIVSVYECNIRKSPGVKKNNTITTLKQKTVGNIQEAKKVKVRLWYKVNTGYLTGWISGKVCRLLDYERGTLLGVLTCNRLNVRELPTIASSVIDKFEVGNLLIIEKRLKNGWLKLTTKSGKTGFVNGRYVDVMIM